MKKTAFFFVAITILYSCQSDLDNSVNEFSQNSTNAKPELMVEWSLYTHQSGNIMLSWHVFPWNNERYGIEPIKNISTLLITNKGYISFDSWYPEMGGKEPADLEISGNDFYIYARNLNLKTNDLLPHSVTLDFPDAVLEGVEWIQLVSADFKLGNQYEVIEAGNSSTIEYETSRHIYHCWMDDSIIYLR